MDGGGATLGFTSQGWSDIEWWMDQDRRTLKRIRQLVTDARRNPTEGMGAPERLRHYPGRNVWSRRITQEHRLVYEVLDGAIVILQARFHY